MATDLTGQQVGSSGTYYDDALKIIYMPTIREQFPKRSLLLSNVEKSSEKLDPSGRFIQGTVSKDFTSGIGAKAEGVALPTAGYEALETFTVYQKYNYARIQISGPVMEASRDSKGALEQVFTRETKSATDGMRKDVNRQLFSNGKGVLALANGSASSTTLTVDSLFGIGYTSPSAVGDYRSATKYLKPNMVIDVCDATTLTTVDVSAKTISSRDSATQVTLASNSSTWDDNGQITRKLANSSEIMGLLGIVSNYNDAAAISTGGIDALQGITRSTAGNDYWDAKLVSTGSVTAPTALQESHLQDAITAVEENDGEVGVFVMSYAQRDSYASTLTGDKRFQNTLDLKGGFKGLTYTGGNKDCGIVADKDAIPYMVFGLDFSSLKMAQQSDVAWMEKDGAVLSRVTNYDAYEATLRLYSNMFTDRPQSNVVIQFVQ